MTLTLIARDPANVRKRAVEPMPGWGKDSDGGVWIRCACGLTMNLDGHAIATDGSITPSLWHDDAACGWHVYGKLADWVP